MATATALDLDPPSIRVALSPFDTASDLAEARLTSIHSVGSPGTELEFAL